MARRRIGIALGLILAFGGALAAVESRGQEPDSAESADEARQRQTMERFLTLLEKKPRRGTALDRVYGYHVERGSLNRLIKSYHERTVADSKDGPAWLLLGLLEAQRGRDAAAVAAFKQAEAARPDDPLASFYLGDALVLVGQPDEAAQAFERAIARKPSRADLLTIFQALGRVHQRAYHTAQALEVWNRLEALFPDDLRVQEQIAATLAEENEPAKALPRYEALARKTSDPYRRVQFRIEAAELKVRLNRTKEALSNFESLLGQLNPESWLYRDVRHRIEEVFLRNDDQAGLTAYYEGWLKQSPEDVEAMARLGRTLAALGRTADAHGWLEKAVKLAPSRKDLRLALVDQLVHEKRFADAATQYEAMARAEPNNPDITRDWGRLLLNDTGRPEAERKQAAAAVWRKLVEGRPNDASTAVLAADLFRQAEMPDEAVALYRKAITLAPESTQYHEYLGEFYHDRKQPKEALAAWREIAEGKNHTAQNVGRLAEVLSGFGYLNEALVPGAEACRLAPDDFDLQIKHAGRLVQLKKYDEALARLDAAGKAADGPEQNEEVLALQIKVYQASEQLGQQIETLRAELGAGRGATAGRWRRLARYHEATPNLTEAAAAIARAVALDEKSVASWTAYARIHEASGDFGGAVDAYRRLAALDRRTLTASLTEVAKLEVKLGRRDNALKAGREVLAAAPGNPESSQFFADLCMQLGEVDEGLNALRRAVRVNPNDTKVLTSLGEALAREFRTEEAIELFWRAFDRTPELDSRLAVVGRLTDLYLQRNQFDRLIARLEREQREAKQPRALAICLAQAYQSSGDFGAARAELEALLATNPRDTVLLRQLVNLAESDADLTAAAGYQAQLNEIAPSDDGTAHLAQLYYQAGEATEAEMIWARLASGQRPPHRVLESIDNLLSAGKAQTALEIAERFLRDHPDSWEGLYREGIALTRLERYDDAERRFRTLLDLQVDEQAESEAAKAATKSVPGRVGQARSGSLPVDEVPLPRAAVNTQAVMMNRYAMESEQSQRGFFMRGMPSAWSPADFGQARVDALSWLVQLAQNQNKLEARIGALRAAKEQAPHDPRPLWDWYYVCEFRQQNRDAFEAALALSRQTPNDPDTLWALFHTLPERAAPGGEVDEAMPEAEEDEQNDKTPPLPAPDLEHVLACYRTVTERKLAWADASIALTVIAELNRAQRKDEAERVYKDAIATHDDMNAIRLNGFVVDKRNNVDASLALLDRFVAREGKQSGNQGMDAFDGALIQLMARRAQARAHADVLKVLDHYFDWYTQPELLARRLQAHHAAQRGSLVMSALCCRMLRCRSLLRSNIPTQTPTSTPNRSRSCARRSSSRSAAAHSRDYWPICSSGSTKRLRRRATCRSWPSAISSGGTTTRTSRSARWRARSTGPTRTPSCA